MRAIAPILTQLARARDEFLEAASVLPESHWKMPPRAGAWSAAEVVTHVGMVEKRVIETAIAGLQNPPQIVPFWKRVHVPLRIVGMRVIKRKSPIPIDPALVEEKASALKGLAARRKSTLEFIEAMCDRDLSDHRYQHPFLGSLNVYDWLRMLAYHDVRHAKQIREIVQVFRQA